MTEGDIADVDKEVQALASKMNTTHQRILAVSADLEFNGESKDPDLEQVENDYCDTHDELASV